MRHCLKPTGVLLFLSQETSAMLIIAATPGNKLKLKMDKMRTPTTQESAPDEHIPLAVSSTNGIPCANACLMKKLLRNEQLIHQGLLQPQGQSAQKKKTSYIFQQRQPDQLWTLGSSRHPSHRASPSC